MYIIPFVKIGGGGFILVLPIEEVDNVCEFILNRIKSLYYVTHFILKFYKTLRQTYFLSAFW